MNNLEVIMNFFKVIAQCVIPFGVLLKIVHSIIKSDVEKKIEDNMTKLLRHWIYEIMVGCWVLIMSVTFTHFINRNERVATIGMYIAMSLIIIIYALTELFCEQSNSSIWEKIKISNKEWLIKTKVFFKKNHYWMYGFSFLGCIFFYYFIYSAFLSIFNSSFHTNFESGADVIKSTTSDYGMMFSDVTEEVANNSLVEIVRFYIAISLGAYIISRVILEPLVIKLKANLSTCYVDVYLKDPEINCYKELKFINMNKENYIFEKGCSNYLWVPKESVSHFLIKSNNDNLNNKNALKIYDYENKFLGDYI